MSRRVAHQPDLFETHPAHRRAAAGSLADELEERPGEEFIQQVRDELLTTLAKARAASRFPWRDLTQTYLVEMRVNSMSRWLPHDEATALRRAFAAEMDRLYEAANEARPMVRGADF